MTSEANRTFEPITTQEEFDERIKARLTREREKWEKGSDYAEANEDLRAQLAAKDEEITAAKGETEQVRKDWYRRETERALERHLAEGGHTDSGKTSRILKHINFDAIEPDPKTGEPHRAHIIQALGAVQQDLPELFSEGRMGYRSAGAADAGARSNKPVFTPEKPITQEGLENMSPQEINSRWGQI